MTDIQIQRMKNTRWLELTNRQLFWHFFGVYALIAVSVFATISTAHVYDNNELYKYNLIKKSSGITLLLYRYIWLGLAMILYFIQRARLKFKVLNIAVAHELFEKAVAETSRQLKWKIAIRQHGFIIAKTSFNWLSWGERITLIWDNEEILINSICDPDKWPSIGSYGMNKLNKDTFEESLKALPNMDYLPV